MNLSVLLACCIHPRRLDHLDLDMLQSYTVSLGLPPVEQRAPAVRAGLDYQVQWSASLAQAEHA